MAKGSLIGLLKGKLGNSIFYRVSNSNNKEKQGVRQYQPTVANPKTQQQVDQRMRMRPAINFYRGLASLLDHSWEGVKYGAMSRQKFMQLALSPTLKNFPYVDKGESRFVPGEYPLSLGSVSVNTSNIVIGQQATFDTYGFSWPSAVTGIDDYSTSWGEFSRALLTQNPALQDGDEITFVFVADADGMYIPAHRYVVLDVNSLATTFSIFKGAGVVLTESGLVQLAGNFVDDAMEYDNILPGRIVAAGIIVSRHPSRTSTTWLRSTSFMKCSDAFKGIWMSGSKLISTRATYQNRAVDLTSDWLLNQTQNTDEGTRLNPTTSYDVEEQTLNYGGTNASMVAMSVDEGDYKPILLQVGSSYYYGILRSGWNIIFNATQRLAGTPAAGSYYTVAQVTPVLKEYTIIDNVTSEPGMETPGN